MPISDITAQYLNSLEKDNTGFIQNNVSPIKPRSKFNDNKDLDELARQLNISPSKQPLSINNNVSNLLRTKYESPSATISSFKSTSSNSSSETPSWANRNYKDLLSKSPTKTPLKQLRKPNLETTSSPKPFTSPSNNVSRDSPGYEYLCRIESIKLWLQQVLNEEIPQSSSDLISYIKFGIHLAKLSNIILPTKRNVFTNDSKLQFKHTENINRFFQLLDYLNMPDLFRFELTDLYDAKNVPKVWFCLHALSYILNKQDKNRFPKMVNLVGKVSFTDDDIRNANRALISAPLPNFSSADSNDDDDLDVTYINNVTSPIKDLSPVKREVPIENPFKEELKIDTRNKEVKFVIKSPTVDKCSDYYTPELEKYIINVIKLQSLARGVNCRYSMFVKKILYKSYIEEFNQLFSIIRGNLSRGRTVHKHRDELRIYDYEIVDLQSIIRRRLIERKIPKQYDYNIVTFQSIIRGKLIKDRMDDIKKKLVMETSNVIDFQSMSRMKLVYKKINQLISHKYEILPSIIQLQSIARTRLCDKFSVSKHIDEDKVVQIQAIIRRNFVIQDINSKHSRIRSQRRKLIELQSISRGGITRTRVCNNVLVNLIYEDDLLNELFAKVRGNSLRKQIEYKKLHLERMIETSVIPIQSLSRGVLCRFHKEIILDDLYDNIDSIINLQSLARGHSIRMEQHSYKQYYLKNVDQVIIAQSIIKRILAQNDYKSLTRNNRPSLSVIRKFAFLLSNNEDDFDKEMELTKFKDTIIEKSKSNEDLENQIEQLDLKLSLLDKNKITIEEFVKPKRIKPQVNTIDNASVLERLNKSARMRIELYQSLFYCLQTKPVYFIRLYRADSKKKFSKDLFESVTSLFPIANGTISHHSREEYYFVKLVLGLMELDAENSTNLSDLTKSQRTFYTDYLHHLNKFTFQRQHLKKSLGKFISNIIEDENLDFESDPTRINIDIIEREIKIHGSSSGDKTLPPQEVIKNPLVSSKFVNNLISLREKAHDLMYIFQQCHFPIHIRLISKHGYELSTKHYPEKSHQQHLAVAGVIFIKHYINSIFNIPENFGYVKEYAKCQDNLNHLSRVMLQLFSMKPFNDNFLRPLNDFIQSSTSQVEKFIISLINVKNIDSEYDLNDYDDILNHEKPKLSMKINDMIKLEKLCLINIDIIAPSQDDPILKSIFDIENLNTSPQDFITLTDLSRLTLILNPITHEEDFNDSKNKSLFTIAKRCLLYIIRVQQEGDDLLELLISGIKPEHEEKFRSIVESEKEEMKVDQRVKNPYHKQSLGDLTKISYHELKKTCLETLLKLESMGELTRKNSFQELLNQISTDIKTKDTQRSKRLDELNNYQTVIKKLSEKHTFLSKQLQEYNQHIDVMLMELIKKPKDKRIFFNIIPVFSKQYFYHRELRKRNRLPKFGSYKYSTKKLLEMKILIDYNFKNSFNLSKLEFMFSCHQVGKFTVEVANNSINIPGASSVITLDALLNLQYENQAKLSLFDGMAVLDSNNFMGFIFKKFYDIKKD